MTPQIAPWRDSGFKINGRPLAIVVKNWEYGVDPNTSDSVSAWCPWYGNKGENGSLPYISQRMDQCQFYNNNTCSNLDDAPIMNAPCLLKQGVGLYMLISSKSEDPNINDSTKSNPVGIVKHLAIKDNTGIYDFSSDGKVTPAGGIIYRYDDIAGVDPVNVTSVYNDGTLYFKILDKYYNDNSGQYKILIKSGVSTEREGIVSYLTSLVLDAIFGENGDDYGIVRSVYESVVGNESYKSVIQSLLVLYVIFTAFSFLTGNLNITHTELIARVIKIFIVSVLISDNSWSFFYDNIFLFFVEGSQQLIDIIENAGASGPGSTDIISLMLAPQTTSKLMSLLFIDHAGFIYIILYYIAVIFLIIVILKATILYLTAMVIIGMIIIMAPIFISFILFDVTRSLFENWLKQLISFMIQPLLIFTGIAFMSLIIRSEIYSTLGFRVCKQGIFNIAPLDQIFSSDAQLDPGQDNSLFYWWFPKVNSSNNSEDSLVDIPVPQDHIRDDDSFCSAYECNDRRYPDFPFLDPDKDYDRINDLYNGNFVHFDSLLLIFIMLYLLYKFNSSTYSIARYLGDTANSWFKIEHISGRASAFLDRPFTTAKSVGAAFFQGFVSRATSSAALAIRSKYYNSLDIKGYKEYRNILQNSELPYLSNANIKNLSTGELKNIIAQKEFKKNYAQLSDPEKIQFNQYVKKISKGGNVIDMHEKFSKERAYYRDKGVIGRFNLRYNSKAAYKVDFNNANALTFAEKVVADQRQIDYNDLKNEMAEIIKEKGYDVFSKTSRKALRSDIKELKNKPNKTEDQKQKLKNKEKELKYYESLYAENIEYRVEKELDKIRKGSTYIENYATDKELDDMMEQALEIKKKELEKPIKAREAINKEREKLIKSKKSEKEKSDMKQKIDEMEDKYKQDYGIKVAKVQSVVDKFIENVNAARSRVERVNQSKKAQPKKPPSSNARAIRSVDDYKKR